MALDPLPYFQKNSEIICLYWPGWEIYFLIFGAPNLFEFSAELFRRRAHVDLKNRQLNELGMMERSTYVQDCSIS